MRRAIPASVIRWVAVGLLLVPMTVLPAACGSSTPSASLSATRTSGVVGVAMMAGGPAVITQSPRPVRGVVVVARRGGPQGPGIGTGTADSSGHFKIDLPPGTYTLVWTRRLGKQAEPQAVTVEPGKYATVTMTLQMR